MKAEHPLIRLERQTALRRAAWRGWLGALLVAALAVGALALWLVVWGRRPGPPPPLATTQAWRGALLVETLAVLVLAPAGAVAVGGAWRRSGSGSWLLTSPWSGLALVLAGAAAPVVAMTGWLAVCAALLAVAGWLAGVGSFGALALVHVQLLVLAVALVAVGSCCTAFFGDRQSAVAVAWLVAAVLAAAPLLLGPFVGLLPAADGVTRGALLVSPVVAVSSALDLDLMRTEWLYRLSPLGQRRLVYPSWWSPLLFLGGLTAVALFTSVRRVAAWRRDALR